MKITILTTLILSFLLVTTNATFAKDKQQNLTKNDTDKLVQSLENITNVADSGECDKGCQKVLDPDEIITLGEDKEKFNIGEIVKVPKKIVIIQNQDSVRKVKIKFHYRYRHCVDGAWGSNPYSGQFGYMGCRRSESRETEEVVRIKLPKTDHKKAFVVEVKTWKKSDYFITVKDMAGKKLTVEYSYPFLGMGTTSLKVKE
jgi:hypothetical protein